MMGILISANFSYAGKNKAIAKANPSLEIQIEELENKDGIEGIAATFFIKGSAEDVWKWIRDVDHLDKLFPAVMKVIKVKDVDTNATIWEYHLDSPLGEKVLNVKRFINDKKLEVKWKRTEGDFNYYGGSWNIKTYKKYPGWVEVRYSNFINAGMFIPYFIVRSKGKSNAKAMAPTLRKLVAQSQK